MAPHIPRPYLVLLAAAAALALGCSPRTGAEAPASSPSGAGSAAPTAATTATATTTPSPTPTPVPLDLRAQRLRIPALGIDAPVLPSQVVPDTSTPRPGCPSPPPGQTTLTVPNQGVASPAEPIEGFEHKVWIFGHSRWQGQPGVLFGLPNLNLGDEVFVDGVDRRTSAEVSRRRFVVDGLYLTDIESGGKLVGAEEPAGVTGRVILQTSVREDGPEPWILNQQQVLAKSRNLIEGDINDPCKYLLLFVFARAS